jgi:biotin carboxylase
MDRRPTVLLISSFFKGGRLIQECKKQDCHTVLVTLDSLKDKEWPWESIDEKFFIPGSFAEPQLTHAISYLARTREIDSIIPLDDFDVEVAASLREHMRKPGIGDTVARHFRDKLAMRMQAKEEDILVPEFVHVLNHKKVDEYLRRVPAPWVLKPRGEAGSVGIKKLQSAEEVWEHIHRLGDRQSDFLIEHYIPGHVFHVDSAVWKGKVVFSLASRYKTPPLDIWNAGGVFVTQTVALEDPVSEPLLTMNAKAITAMGLTSGVIHAEYIEGKEDGRLRFLEMAARVGGANIDLLVEAASGVNLWREWPKIELASLRKESYKAPIASKNQAGLLVCLSRNEKPDLSALDAPEVWWKEAKEHHAALIVAAPTVERVDQLLNTQTTWSRMSWPCSRPPAATKNQTLKVEAQPQFVTNPTRFAHPFCLS